VAECTHALKRQNRSVYCTLLDQWVSERYCEHACQKRE